MSTKQDWRERWEDKDKDGNIVIRIAFWEDGEPARYEFRSKAYGTNCITPDVSRLIPRKPAPVVIPWEPDEVPVGAVVRHKDTGTRHVILGKKIDDECVSFDIGGYGSATPKVLYYSFVLHQPKVDTKDCQPCGKVVGS